MKPAWLNVTPKERVLVVSEGELDVVLADIAQANTTGYCLGCGAESGAVEPDAVGYACDACGKPRVCGAEQLLLMGRFVTLGADGKAHRVGY